MSSIKQGDILIRRVNNGWIITTFKNENENSDDIYQSVTVYQDPEDFDFNYSSSCSLTKAIREVFIDFLQTKKTAGFTIKCHEKGYE